MANINDIQQYIDFLSTTDIEELEITAPDGEVILLKRKPGIQYSGSIKKQQSLGETESQIKQESTKEEQKDKKEFVITSPMVGKFLLSISKDHPPFIVEGAQIKQGQKVAVIETMKILRDVVSPQDGVVKKILVEDSKFVEYGQPLIVLEEVK
ncbi:MAG: hypothetical protein NZ928_07220 [Endomicrobia bacterium]|nr:hypothetical protein [Endomicrobiia bacterium]MCX7940244.1 hypothetical protein [Endomicrobiia bacterium]MDW8055852.1 acetyl-CoA carboxylase biotin carboxyl carrier protein subunit [Elusimicrobiota bacterium]